MDSTYGSEDAQGWASGGACAVARCEREGGAPAETALGRGLTLYAPTAPVRNLQ
jgi:hypothetical protein